MIYLAPTRNTLQLGLIFAAIILFFFAITLWWLSLANPALEIWSIILFFLSIVLIINLIIFTLFDLQKRIEKLELVYKIKALEGTSAGQELDIKIVSLSNWEKRIINHLQDNDGELTQTQIRNLTGLSRSNVSNHLKSLESKNIIRKEPYQRTNKIILIKNIIK